MRPVHGDRIDDREKLRRWAAAHSSVNPPSLLIVKTDDEPRTLVFSGWCLGHGAEGRGFEDECHEWKRREATIYLTSDGKVLCVRLWVTTERWLVFRQIREYSSDLALLKPLGEDGREEADKCVRIAVRKAAKKCPLFGVFGVVWPASEVPVVNSCF